jgi:hypothetical protein
MNKIIFVFLLFTILTCNTYATSYLTVSIIKKSDSSPKIYLWGKIGKYQHGDMNDVLNFLKTFGNKGLIINVIYEGNNLLNEEMLFLKKIFDIGFKRILLSVIDKDKNKVFEMLLDVKSFKTYQNKI